MRASVPLLIGAWFGVLAGSAVAAPPVMDHPEWLRKPTLDELMSALPAKASNRGVNGSATMRCTVTTKGLLIDCKVVEEKPTGYGFGAAALMLSTMFQMKPARSHGLAVESTATIPIKWVFGGDWVQPSISVMDWAPWLSAPTYDQVAAAYPSEARSERLEGHVVLRCHLTREHRLAGCNAVSEQPPRKGFARSALLLARDFQAALPPLKWSDLADLEVNLPIDFPAPGARSAARYLDQVDWVRKLDPAKAQAVYPDQAVKAGVKSGEALVDCTVAQTGALSGCKTVSESPAGLGFGEAAVHIASEMAANLWTRDGQPAVGAHIRLPLQLQYAGHDLGAAQASSPAPAQR